MEQEVNSVDLFEALASTTVFWDVVPVLVQRNDRDEGVEDLSVRLMSGHTRHNQNMKVIRVYIFKESDPYFLHALEVSEEDFQTLKVEQGILVDFTNFSGKIVDLLNRCISSREEDPPQFRAVLMVSPGESVFQVVETNDFKQLPHISLRFRPGTDVAIKAFLAFRLTEVKGEAASTRKKLATCTADLEQANQTLQECQERMKTMDAAHTRLVLETEANAKDVAASARNERVREREELLQGFERCIFFGYAPRAKHWFTALRSN
jgi:spindle assembly abnormal protein 6